MLRPWRTIEDYNIDPAELSNKELNSLALVWVEQLEGIEQTRSFAEFNQRIKREWAIETGLIERLYSLDRGIVELMMQHGIEAARIPHDKGGQEGSRITAMINDQQDAIESVFSFVNGCRKLTTGYIKELHSLFTRNQKFVEGRNQFGHAVQTKLIRGEYKQQPNNPTRPDDTLHSYCPPEQVASEMDRLITFHSSHGAVAPEVEAAWLHHRFTQIHPFQDGNGRMARALATLVFVKASWLPLVVRNSDRNEYMTALEKADYGDLKPLVALFSALQKAEFIRAISIARDVERATGVDARIEAIRQRVAQKKGRLQQEWQAAISTAEQLHTHATRRLEAIAAALDQAMRDKGTFSFRVDEDTDRGPHRHYFRRQIVHSAKALGYYANLPYYHSWVRFVATDGNQGNILISFHGIGHEFQGVLACSGTWFLRARSADGNYETEGETTLGNEVFQFNYKEDARDVEIRFGDWLEEVVERGLAAWEQTL